MVPLPDAPAVDEALLSEIVAVAFSQRRKLLRHTLGRWLEERGAAPGFDLQRRAEEVGVQEYVGLALRVAAG
jgi:16S rRNA (adenine1518-N6/adenine1519-N6)-dimethyltransferase